jgi:uncharacterized protein
MAKPAGARCNLNCAYCYYLAKAELFPRTPQPRMADDLLETYIRQRLQDSAGPVTLFEWHGGEPTLLGLDYFRRIVALQQAHRPPDRIIANGLQTNGTLLDESWARFLAQERFSVGLSLDGPAPCHDAYRLDRGGRSSHAETVRAFRLLRRHGVHCDVLCVLHAANVPSPLPVYRFFRDLGVTHLQFLPLVQPAGPGVSAATAAPEAIGEFLCAVFDDWIRNDLGRIAVQNFDEAFRTACGLPHALCTFRETCGDVLVLEHDGSVYACDHFVDAGHRLGSLGQQTLAGLCASPALAAFGRLKRDGLPARCRACPVLAWCNGGCPKDRILAEPSGEPGVNWLCPAYRRFFGHCRPALARLAAHRKAGRPLRAFAPPGPVARARANDPCPCGSGIKYKRCCQSRT